MQPTWLPTIVLFLLGTVSWRCLAAQPVPEIYSPPGMKFIMNWKTMNSTREFWDKLKGGAPRAEIPIKRALPHLSMEAANLTEADLPRHQRCALMLGTACQQWWSQTGKADPLKPYPQGSKECPNNCNGQGTCNYDIGECQCTAGFGGKGCTEPVRRPCSYRGRAHNDPPDTLVGAAPLDQQGWTASRCAGECDETLGLCYCGYNSTFGRVPAPAGSPWGTPPIKQGIPLVVPCQPGTGPQGQPLSWGSARWESLYGPNGWCNNPRISRNCPCAVENLHGDACEVVSESWCPNQCNLRGQCLLGFCKCDEGWYGTACDKHRANATYTPVDVSKHARGVQEVWREPLHSKQPFNHSVHRKRPFIYVYDLPAEYNTRMSQIKNTRNACNWRRFDQNNNTATSGTVYMVETYLHETLLTSTHRTLDPEEADFFYVPVYYTCYAWPVLGWTDGPWFAPMPHPGMRPYHAAHMYLGAKRWLQQAYPYWNRSQGRDHIFLTAHDEGACYLPTEIYKNAVILTHWGRTDEDHTSGTAYGPDFYGEKGQEAWLRQYVIGDWTTLYRGHRCYTPGKDLVIPAFKEPETLRNSPLLGAPPLEKDILFYFKGDAGLHREWWYSRGIRQTLYRLALEDDWWGKYRMVVVHRDQLWDHYTDSLSRSKFCLVAPGDGWSARAEDAVLHGCIPVVIQDEVEMIFHDLLDWSEFGVRVAQKDIYDLPKILLAFTEEQVRVKQAALAKVWHRFFYATGPWHRHSMPSVYHGNRNGHDVPERWGGHLLAPLDRFPVKNDAFHTIMQWLYGRMPEVSQQFLRQRHKPQ